MIDSRPEFEKISSFDEFNKYYWYRDELSQICKSLGLENRGTKQELNDIIEQYFKGILIKKSLIKRKKKQVLNSARYFFHGSQTFYKKRLDEFTIMCENITKCDKSGHESRVAINPF